MSTIGPPSSEYPPYFNSDIVSPSIPKAVDLPPKVMGTSLWVPKKQTTIFQESTFQHRDLDLLEVSRTILKRISTNIYEITR
jgi:hypothetical protein